jgi:hypothetical protein
MRAFKGGRIHRLLHKWLSQREAETKDLAVSQSPDEPTNFARAQGVYREYQRLVQSFDSDLLEFLKQEEIKYGRESDDD